MRRGGQHHQVNIAFEKSLVRIKARKTGVGGDLHPVSDVGLKSFQRTSDLVPEKVRHGDELDAVGGLEAPYSIAGALPATTNKTHPQVVRTGGEKMLSVQQKSGCARGRRGSDEVSSR